MRNNSYSYVYSVVKKYSRYALVHNGILFLIYNSTAMGVLLLYILKNIVYNKYKYSSLFGYNGLIRIIKICL